MINRTLTTLVSGMVSKTSRNWDVKLAHVEFTYNRAPSYTTSHFPFEVCYGLNPLAPIDLIHIPHKSRVSFETETRAKEIKMLYEQVGAQIEKMNEQYKHKANKNHPHLEFKLGDLVWLHLRKEIFPLRRKNKLMAKGKGP